MKLYHTNLHRDYGLSAGFNSTWSGLREIIQNGLDGRDKGYELKVSHLGPSDRTRLPRVKVSNDGVVLSTSNLIMGFTTKAGDNDQRGQHGEGLIVGINALLRNNCSIVIRTGNEKWIPKHLTVNEVPTLVFEIHKMSTYVDKFSVEVRGISKEQWQEYQENILDFTNAKPLKTAFGSILTDHRFKNKLFVKGIYVGRLPENSNFGWDLPLLDLNRDREVANTWDISRYVRLVLEDSLKQGKVQTNEMFEILCQSDTLESRSFRYLDFVSKNSFYEQMTSSFEEQHGENAIPCENIAETEEVSRVGLKPIQASVAVKNIIEKVKGTLDEVIKAKKSSITKVYYIPGLPKEERENFSWCFLKTDPFMDSQCPIRVASFVDDSLDAVYKDETIYVNKKLLSKKYKILKAILEKEAEAQDLVGSQSTKFQTEALAIIATSGE